MHPIGALRLLAALRGALKRGPKMALKGLSER